MSLREWRAKICRGCPAKYFDRARKWWTRPGHSRGNPLCSDALPLGKRCTFAACPRKEAAG